MLAWGLAQLAGSFVLLWQPVLPHAGWFLLSFPIALAALSASNRRWLAAFWLGAALTAWQADRNLEDRLDLQYDGQVVELRGRIVGLVEREQRRQRFRFLVESGEINGRTVDMPRSVRLSLYDDSGQRLDIATGERWRWRAKLRRPRGLANPGGFDYERWLFAEGTGATGYVRNPAEAERLSAPSGEWRARIARRVAALVDGPSGGLLRGLATGDRRGISDEQWERLRATGTAHLMAISGLHIGLVAGLVLGMASGLRRRWLQGLPSWGAAALAALLAFVYGALAGFGLPIRRALTGLVIVLAALAWRRVIAPGHAFGLALALVLCLDPLAPLTTGFWLSFGAVAAILVMLAGRRPRGSSWRQLLRVQGGLFLLMAPFIAASFGQLPLVSPVANLVAIPVFAVLVVPLVLCGLLLLPWPALAAGVFWLAEQVLDQLMMFLGLLHAVDPAFVLPLPGLAGWLCAAAGLVLLVLPAAWPGRVLTPWLLLPAIWPLLPVARDAPPLAMHFLDVGQGLAVVVETPDRTLVYDTGPRFGAADAAERVIIPFLRERGREPDVIMVSHGDSDHAGGLDSLAAAFPGAQVSGRTDVPGAVADCAGQAWEWQDVSFRVLHPLEVSRAADNGDSCVLRIEVEGFSALLTGDIESTGEARMLRTAAVELKADVALVPHHGSRTSSTPAFIDAVAPALAVAAAGHGNRWGFPKEDVARRWENAGAVLLATGEQGCISVVFDGSVMHIENFRDQRRLWREAPSQPGSLIMPVR